MTQIVTYLGVHVFLGWLCWRVASFLVGGKP